MHDYLRIYLKNSAQKAKKDQQNKDKEIEAAVKGKSRGACTPRTLPGPIFYAMFDQPRDRLALLLKWRLQVRWKTLTEENRERERRKRDVKYRRAQ